MSAKEKLFSDINEKLLSMLSILGDEDCEDSKSISTAIVDLYARLELLRTS